MYKLGMIQLKGLLGQTKNPRDAINWLKRAADQADENNPHALHQLVSPPLPKNFNTRLTPPAGLDL